LHAFVAMAHRGRKVVIGSFIISLLYNVVGLSIAFQGMMSPLVAAILMPSSSISIIIITWLGIETGRRKLGSTIKRSAGTKVTYIVEAKEKEKVSRLHVVTKT
jgi:hypothetical protein